MFLNTTPDLQVQDQDKGRSFWSQTGLILRPSVSAHISVTYTPYCWYLARTVAQLVPVPVF